MNETYHYTIADRLVKILIDGYINVMQSDLQIKNEVRLCWLTVNPEWDKTAFYGYPEEVLDNAGRIRITLGGTYHPHHKFRDRIYGVVSLELSAKMAGVEPSDWRVTPETVPVNRFTKIELWKNKQWVEIPIKRIV